MKANLAALVAMLVMAGAASAGAAELPTPVENAGAAPMESAAERDARMQWWREARFGMFVHWGLYSGLAGTWEGKEVRGASWLQARGKIDTDTYAGAAIPLFKPSADFAREWAKLAREAGCRYVVFTTKHHDGFGLYASEAGDFNAGAVLGRDLVREIVDALRAEGLRVGFYHSVIDWHHPEYAYALSKQLPHPLRDTPYPNGTRDHAKYLEYLHTQVDELVSNYGPLDIMWWDYSAVDFQGDEAWRAGELMRKVRAKQPEIIMNNRLYRLPEAGFSGMGTGSFVGRLDPKYADFITPEQHVPATGLPGVDWETCMTMNKNWGFNENDHDWKSSETLIRNLIDIASKGGNYLLNIGPKVDGSVPEESIEAMRAIGEWLKVNGDAIYATEASPFAELPWGRCTRREIAEGRTRLFLHLFDWPADGRLHVPLHAEQMPKASLLAGGVALAVSREGEGIVIALPAKAPNPVATVVVVEVEGDWKALGGGTASE